MTLNWIVRIQTGANSFRNIKIAATNQVIAWSKATEKNIGVVIEIHLAQKGEPA